MPKFTCSDGLVRDLPIGTAFVEEYDDIIRYVVSDGVVAPGDEYVYPAENFTPWKVYKEIPLPDPEIDVTQYSDGWYVGIFKSTSLGPFSKIFQYDKAEERILGVDFRTISGELLEVVGPVKTKVN